MLANCGAAHRQAALSAWYSAQGIPQAFVLLGWRHAAHLLHLQQNLHR